MKCKDCIFEIDSVCINPQSDWCDMKLFPEGDGDNGEILMDLFDCYFQKAGEQEWNHRKQSE